MVAPVSVLEHTECGSLNADRLAELYVELGQSAAEGAVCRALEDLSECLHRISAECIADDLKGVKQSAREMLATADHVGMHKLANIARDVEAVAARYDYAAVGGTVGRLLRVGESSLTSVWDLKELLL